MKKISDTDSLITGGCCIIALILIPVFYILAAHTLKWAAFEFGHELTWTQVAAILAVLTILSSFFKSS